MIANTRSAPTRPFLKWTGGKQWLSFVIGDALEGHRHRHYIDAIRDELQATT